MQESAVELQLVLRSLRSFLRLGRRRVAHGRSRDLEQVLALLGLDDRDQDVRGAADEVDLRESRSAERLRSGKRGERTLALRAGPFQHLCPSV